MQEDNTEQVDRTLDRRRIVAREYVDKQWATMRKYGSAPEDVSEEEYRGFVEEIAEKMDLIDPLAVSKRPGKRVSP